MIRWIREYCLNPLPLLLRTSSGTFRNSWVRNKLNMETWMSTEFDLQRSSTAKIVFARHRFWNLCLRRSFNRLWSIEALEPVDNTLAGGSWVTNQFSQNDAFDIAGPSSMQNACHVWIQKWPRSPQSSLKLSGTASERRIQRSEVWFLMGNLNFSFVRSL